MNLSPLLVLVLSCGPGGEPSTGATDLERLLPMPSVLEGWRVAEAPTAYVPDSLYEYLDGGAPRYVSYGFRRLLHVRYEHEDDPLAGVTLDLFDMGGKLGAFGIYRSGLPEGDGRRAWCAEGYLSRNVAAAWKGRVYVHAVADDERAGPVEMLERIVGRACDGIVGDPSLPVILDPLPLEGRVPGSERYVAADLLGHEFLPGGVLAAYEFDGQRAHLFFSDLGSEAAATEALASLRDHYERWGQVGGDVPSIGGAGFSFSERSLGSGLAVTAGRFVAGIHGDLPRDVQERLIGKLGVKS